MSVLKRTSWCTLFLFGFFCDIYSCTIFNARQNDVILVGNNEDWKEREPYIKVIPADGPKYGRICFGFGSNCRYEFGGVNDRRLFYDIASLTRREDIEFDADKETVDNTIYAEMLEKCACVEEAIEFLDGYNIQGFIRHHIMIVDSSGASAILEWGRDTLSVIRKSGSFQVMANFNNTDPTLAGWYPCWRFDRAEEMLEQGKEVSVEHFRLILDAVHNSGESYPTVYSNIYDLKNGKIYVYFFHNFAEFITLDLGTELAGKKHTYFLPEMFSALELLAPEQAQSLDSSTVNFVWRGSAKRYTLVYSADPDFQLSERIDIIAATEPESADSEVKFALIGSALLGLLLSRRQKYSLFLLLFLPISNCAQNHQKPPACEVRQTVLDLQRGSTYYWKVVAKDNEGISSESVVRSFSIR